LDKFGISLKHFEGWVKERSHEKVVVDFIQFKNSLIQSVVDNSFMTVIKANLGQSFPQELTADTYIKIYKQTWKAI
jgi:hypothetical protein